MASNKKQWALALLAGGVGVIAIILATQQNTFGAVTPVPPNAIVTTPIPITVTPPTQVPTLPPCNSNADCAAGSTCVQGSCVSPITPSSGAPAGTLTLQVQNVGFGFGGNQE